jgi:hypothetical protein
MTVALDGRLARPVRRWLGSPLIALVAVLSILPLILALPLRVPIGPMYWDLFVYFDAARRIFDGQIPVNDFFTPVGPLGYYLFAGLVALLPNAQPALLVHWSLLVVTAPLMAIIIAEIDARSRPTAFAVLIPFLVYALLPFNTRDYYPFPGSDGFGIYNRQVCQMLYVLVAALVFVRGRWRLTLVVSISVAALFFLKVTGFIAAIVLCAFAVLAGRISIRQALLAAASFLALLAGMEALSGIISHYVRDILALVALNTESLAPRFLQAASHTFGVVAPAGALALLLIWSDRRKLADRFKGLRREGSWSALNRFFHHDAFWIAAAVFAGIVFETQNTGSQAMIFLWPVILAVLMRSASMMAAPGMLIATLALAAAAVLPTFVNTIERAARTYAGSVKNKALEHEHLKTLGAVTMRPDVLQRARVFSEFYPEHRETFEDLVERGELPSFILYSDYDFQILHLMGIDRAVASLKALEAERNIRFETIMAINFVNPFPWLMERSAPRHVAIGADPTRAVPPPDRDVAEAVAEVDIALLPACPPTTANASLLALYRPLMPEHRRIRLNDCYDAFIHPKFAGRL